jgi:GAF domain-containing protein
MPGLDALDRPTVCLEDVLRTGELRRRPSRPPDHAAENRALAALAATMAQAPRAILQKLVDTALELCRADSAGISILESDGDREAFRWRAIAGRFGANVGEAMARDASPCGTVLDRDAVLLFAHPERHFASSVPVDPPLVEALLAPFHAGGEPAGTVWVISHTEGRRFDAEDARLLESLSRFAGAAYQMIGALDAAEAGRAELERRVAERTRELSGANDALRGSEARLEAELSAIRLLQERSTRLVDCADLPSALREVLDAAIALLGAHMGNVRLYNPRRRVLEMAASRGFGPDLLARSRESPSRTIRPTAGPCGVTKPSSSRTWRWTRKTSLSGRPPPRGIGRSCRPRCAAAAGSSWGWSPRISGGLTDRRIAIGA